MKNTIVWVSVILMIVCCALIFNANKDVKGIRDDLHGERYQRMVAEEKLQAANTKIRSLSSENEDLKEKLQNIQEILTLDRDKNSDLKAQLQDEGKARQELERRLRELERNLGTVIE